ncbi:class I SAM-dependent methyltransferase [Patescibacteria group bacterium]|nr:class I SAM-dependent methyltransferase [Patescibacteria group bacterium]MBU1921939.1 class I SAM-dependent methyltransferase [Patescibacteria group bacterium]
MFFKRNTPTLRKHHILKPYVEGRTLDIGYASYPSPVAENFYGIDIQKIEPPQGYIEVKSVDLNHQEIPYEDGFFSTVLAIDTVEHLMSPLNLFLKVNKILHMGGRFIICIPNPYFYKEIIVNLFANKYIKPNCVPPEVAHINLPSRRIVRTLFHWSGFSLEKEVGINFPIPKTKIVTDMKRFPSISYEIMYIGKKITENPKFSIISKQKGVGWVNL